MTTTDPRRRKPAHRSRRVTAGLAVGSTLGITVYLELSHPTLQATAASQSDAASAAPLSTAAATTTPPPAPPVTIANRHGLHRVAQPKLAAPPTIYQYYYPPVTMDTTPLTAPPRRRIHSTTAGSGG